MDGKQLNRCSKITVSLFRAYCESNFLFFKVGLFQATKDSHIKLYHIYLMNSVVMFFFIFMLLHVSKSQSFNIYAALITRATGTGNSYTLIN